MTPRLLLHNILENYEMGDEISLFVCLFVSDVCQATARQNLGRYFFFFFYYFLYYLLFLNQPTTSQSHPLDEGL